ncbi:MAG: hypothetical protein R3C03_21375 [Pirellulaceae bacterium]
MHLWFLYYLLIFTLLAAVFSQCNRLKFDWLFVRPGLLLLLPLALVPGVIGGGLPMAAPESFIPTWWPIVFYGLFYWFGWQLLGRELMLDRLQPWCWPLTVIGILLFIPHYLLLPTLDVELIQASPKSQPLAQHLLESILAAYLSALLTLLALLIG